MTPYLKSAKHPNQATGTALDAYTVIGHPIDHSKSPIIHQAFAQQTQQSMTYSRTLGRIDHFAEDVYHFIAAGGKGLNVTVPFKTEAYALADTLGPEAQAAAAVNTLTVQPDGTLRGDNTDGTGLVHDLHYHGVALRDQRILMLGAGGAAYGILHPLLNCEPASITIANRNAGKAHTLAARAATARVSGCGLAEIPAEPYDVIINATAAGLNDQVPTIPMQTIGSHSRVYDLLYSDQPTAFMRWATDLGAAQVLDGLGMLVEQAAAAFYQWRGVQPDTTEVRAMLRPNTEAQTC